MYMIVYYRQDTCIRPTFVSQVQFNKLILQRWCDLLIDVNKEGEGFYDYCEPAEFVLVDRVKGFTVD